MQLKQALVWVRSCVIPAVTVAADDNPVAACAAGHRMVIDMNVVDTSVHVLDATVREPTAGTARIASEIVVETPSLPQKEFGLAAAGVVAALVGVYGKSIAVDETHTAAAVAVVTESGWANLGCAADGGGCTEVVAEQPVSGLASAVDRAAPYRPAVRCGWGWPALQPLPDLMATQSHCWSLARTH